MLAELMTSLVGRAVIGLFPAHSREDDVVIQHEGRDLTCYMLRQQVTVLYPVFISLTLDKVINSLHY